MPWIGNVRPSNDHARPPSNGMTRGASSRNLAGTRVCHTSGGSTTWSSTEIIHSSSSSTVVPGTSVDTCTHLTLQALPGRHARDVLPPRAYARAVHPHAFH